ncbi:glycosyltransferase family 1 protein [Isosphaeraceae bacterium EP7]
MRIVVDGRRLGLGQTGVGRYLEVLLHGWADAGGPPSETLVILHDPAGLDLIPNCPNMTAQVRGVGWPGLAWERIALGRSYRPGDVLFAPTNLIPANWPGPSVLVLFDTLLWTAPQGFTWRNRVWFGRRMRLAAHRASLVIVPSRATFRGVIEHLGIAPDRLRTVDPAVAPEFHPRTASDPVVLGARAAVGLGDADYLLFLGKPSVRRNLPALLAGFERHRRNHPLIKLVLAGPGTEALGGPDGVIAAGRVPDAVLYGLVAGARALVYPSSEEGFGLPILEALASGCPAVTSVRGALAESGGDAAYDLGEVGPGSIAAALDRLADDPAERSVRITRGLAHAARFTVAAFAQGVGRVLEEAYTANQTG